MCVWVWVDVCLCVSLWVRVWVWVWVDVVRVWVGSVSVFVSMGAGVGVTHAKACLAHIAPTPLPSLAPPSPAPLQRDHSNKLEALSVNDALAAMRSAHVVLLLAEADKGLSRHDLKLASMVRAALLGYAEEENGERAGSTGVCAFRTA